MVQSAQAQERGLSTGCTPDAMVWPVIATFRQWCWHGYSAASSALTFAASLPATCRESIAHAALTCGGVTPSYFTPGFVPLQLAWGWLLVGVLCGILARHVASRWWPSPARPEAPDALADCAGAWCVAADEVVRSFALAVEAGIWALANQAGQSPVSLLCRLLQQASVPPDSNRASQSRQHETMQQAAMPSGQTPQRRSHTKRR